MVAGLLGCWFRVGGARPAVAGRVISIIPVSPRGNEASRVPEGGPFCSARCPGVLGRVLREGQALGPRVCVFLCCVRARLFVCVFFERLGVRVSAGCVSVSLYTYVGGCQSVRPLVVRVCLLYISVCDFQGVYCVYVCISEGLCVCPSACACVFCVHV